MLWRGSELTLHAQPPQIRLSNILATQEDKETSTAFEVLCDNSTRDIAALRGALDFALQRRGIDQAFGPSADGMVTDSVDLLQKAERRLTWLEQACICCLLPLDFCCSCHTIFQ